MSKNTAKAISEIYEETTKSIITQLENGCVPWVRPWEKHTEYPIPFNTETGRFYTGGNMIILFAAGANKSLDSNCWMTAKQINNLGGFIRKGEKATRALLYKQSVRKQEMENIKTGKTEECDVVLRYLRYYPVFAIEQTEGVENLKTYDNSKMPSIEDFIEKCNPEITQTCQTALYSPSENLINMPMFDTFQTSEHYYATILHELVHWTSHETRLDRDTTNRALEELVAELGAAFLGAMLGIKGQLQHADYIGSWIEALKDDSKAIFKAATAAQKAANYLLELQE